MIIVAPNAHRLSVTIVHSAVPGLPTQLPWLIPNRPSTWLTSPVPPKICRHSTAIATLAPISDGR